MPKVYSYARFSRAEQKEGDSLRRQLQGARDFAAQHGLQIDEALRYTDEGLSAFRGLHAETGALSMFLYEVEIGTVKRGDYLVLENLDRLSRQNVLDAITLLNKLINAGVLVVTTYDNRIYSKDAMNDDPMSLMMAMMAFIRANEESATKSKRLKSSWSNKREHIGNKPLTGKVPGWIKLVDRKLTLIDDRAAIVRRIYDMYLAGKGQHSIAKTLTDENIECWGIGKQKAEEWHVSYIIKTLDNPAVIGKFTPHVFDFSTGRKKRMPLSPIEDYYPAAISAETFARVRELRDGRKINGRKSALPLLNMFSGVLRCQHCNSPMTRVPKGSKSKVYLVCTAAKTGRKSAGSKICTGGYESIRYDKIEDSFVNAVRSGVFRLPENSDAENVLEIKIVEARERMEEAQSKISNYVAEIGAGTLKGNTVIYSMIQRPDMSNRDFTLAEEIEVLQEVIEANRKAIQKLTTQLQTLRPLVLQKKFMESVEAVLTEPMNIEQANAALCSLCSMTVDKDAINVKFKHGEEIITIPWRDKE